MQDGAGSQRKARQVSGASSGCPLRSDMRQLWWMWAPMEGALSLQHFHLVHLTGGHVDCQGGSLLPEACTGTSEPSSISDIFASPLVVRIEPGNAPQLLPHVARHV